MLKFDFDCSSETLVELLCDPEFVIDRSLAMGDLEAECEVYEEEDVTTVISQRRIVRDLPGFLQRVFDPVQQVKVVEQWRATDQASWRCQQEVDIEGVPLKLSAAIEVAPTEAGCCYRIRQSARAKLPLIGGRLESFSINQAQYGVKDDMRYVREHLE